MPGAEELVKKIRAPWFVTVNLTEGHAVRRYRPRDEHLRRPRPGPAASMPSAWAAADRDHASFAGVKKPFVYYMAAMTTDYHQPSDSVEKVSGELIAKISQHGYLTIFKFADQ